MTTGTTPTHPMVRDPIPKTGRYEATSLGMTQYIIRCKLSQFPLKNGAHEFGYILTELDKALGRIEALEAELAAKSKSKTKADKEA